MSSHTITTTDPTTDIITGRRLGRGGVAGLAATAAFLATAVLTTASAIEAPDGVADMARFLSAVRDAELAIILYAVAGVALCVLYVPMSRAVTDLLQGRRAARFGTVSVVAGLVILLPAYVLAAVGTVGLARANESGSDATTLFDAHEAMSLAGEVCFAVGSLLSLGVGPFLWGLAGRAGREIPRWMSGLALGVGVTGLVWAVPPSEHPVVMILVLLNVLGALVLFAALSRRLLRFR